MVGILVSFWDGVLSGAMLVLGSVSIQMMVLIVLGSLPVVIPLSFLLVG